MTATSHVPLSRHSWLLSCRLCGDRVRLTWPEDDLDADVWQNYVDRWEVEHENARAGQVAIVRPSDTPGLPPAVLPHDLPVARCVS